MRAAIICYTLALVAVFLLLLLASSLTHAKKVEHFIHMMFENRAFCHFASGLGIKGLDACHDNKNCQKSATGKEYCFHFNATDKSAYDPDHSFDATTFQVMGKPYGWQDPAPMDGFVKEAAARGHRDLWTEVSGVRASQIPAFASVAREFAIFNRYYSSFPGPTVINRVFAHLGQSNATTCGGPDYKKIIEGYPGPSIYDEMEKHNVSYGIFFEDVTDVWYAKTMRELPKLLKYFHTMDQFYNMSAAGTLPQFSFLSPRYNSDLMHLQPSDCHPEHLISVMDRLLGKVYKSIRNGPKWNSSAFMVSWDEHGGFADSVPPPQNVPNPIPGRPSWDNKHPFNFTRLGVRVASLLASPLIPRGTVVQEPETAHYDHTSLYKTIKHLWSEKMGKAPWLSARQEWAAPFDHLFSLDEPRTDCPLEIPVAEAPSQEAMDAVALSPPGELQVELLVMVEALLGRDGRKIARQFKTKAEMGEYVKERVAQVFEHAKRDAKLRGMKDLVSQYEERQKANKNQ